MFSQGRLILPHVRSKLSAQLIHALLCLGKWSLLNLVKDVDVLAKVNGDEDIELDNGWDRIVLPEKFSDITIYLCLNYTTLARVRNP